MTIGVFASTFQPQEKNDGSINANGVLHFYEPGQSGSTYKVVYSDYELTSSLGSQVTLDSNGRKAIYLNGDYDLIEKDSAGNTIVTRSNINPDQSTAITDINLISNGSFETNASSIPSSWTLFEWNAGANVVDNSAGNFKHGAYAMKFVSTGSGGGTLTTNSFFAVSDARVYTVEFLMKCSDTGLRNIVQFLWYDEDQVALGTPSTSVYDDAGTSGNTTSWSRYLRSAIPPTGARYAKLKLIGADSSDGTSGSVWFDGVFVTESLYEPVGVIKQFGSATAPNGYLNCDGSAVSRTTYVDLYTVISTTYGTGDGSTTFNLPHFGGRVPVGIGTGTLAETVAEASWTNSGGSLAAAVTSNTDTWITGMKVQMTTTNTLPTGLSLATDYYVIRASSTSLKFATSLANAVAGTAIAWTNDGTGNHTITHTLTARTIGQKIGEETHANTISESAAHTHTTDSQGAHTHTLDRADVSGGAGGDFGLTTLSGGAGADLAYNQLVSANSTAIGGVNSNGAHTHTAQSTGSSAAHNNMPPCLAINYIIKY